MQDDYHHSPQIRLSDAITLFWDEVPHVITSLQETIRTRLAEIREEMRKTREYLKDKDFVDDSTEKLLRELESELIAERVTPQIKTLERIVYETRPRHVKRNSRGVTQEQIQKAKEYPIAHFLDVREGFPGNIKCPFHDDRNPSAHVYWKRNTLHCFGECSRTYDAIDLYQLRSGGDFLDAVRTLSK